VSYRAHGDGWCPRPHDWRPRYHHYYYRSWPRYYVYGGWGTGWYDPWWWGNYWWPEPTQVIVVHHYYDRDYDDTVRNAPYFDGAEWMDAELQTALTDVAVAWSVGDIELLQAHLTPKEPVAIRHDWEQKDPWVLAPPVLLDMLVEALDAQKESHFRFVQIEEMEPGLAWAVAEHRFTLRDEDRERQATMEFMFRRYGNAWLVEAIVAGPENYWWADPKLLDDAATESTRLFEEMDRAGTSDSE